MVSLQEKTKTNVFESFVKTVNIKTEKSRSTPKGIKYLNTVSLKRKYTWDLE